MGTVDALLDCCTDIAEWRYIVRQGIGDDETIAQRIAAIQEFPDSRLGVGQEGDPKRRTMDTIRVALRLADPSNQGERAWVSSEMIDLLHAAEHALPEAPFIEGDLPWDKATIVFDKPLFVSKQPYFGTGDKEIAAPVWGVQWTKGSRYSEERGVEPGAVIIWWMENPGIQIRGHRMTRLLPGMSTAWAYGELPSADEDSELGAHYHRLLFTLWSMLRDKIGIQEKRRAPKASARRFQRAHGQPADDITVVTLRRAEATPNYRPNGSHTIDHTHRWIVGGHWRNQWYPSMKDHRPKWIAPYVKGPDDKPIVVKEKVYAWRR